MGLFEIIAQLRQHLPKTIQEQYARELSNMPGDCLAFMLELLARNEISCVQTQHAGKTLYKFNIEFHSGNIEWELSRLCWATDMAEATEIARAFCTNYYSEAELETTDIWSTFEVAWRLTTVTQCQNIEVWGTGPDVEF